VFKNNSFKIISVRLRESSQNLQVFNYVNKCSRVDLTKNLRRITTMTSKKVCIIVLSIYAKVISIGFKHIEGVFLDGEFNL